MKNSIPVINIYKWHLQKRYTIITIAFIAALLNYPTGIFSQTSIVNNEQCKAKPGQLFGSGNFCNGEQINIGIPTTKKDQTYTWYLNGTKKVKGPVTGNGDAISYNTEASARTAGHYTVVTEKEGCTSTEFGDVNVAYIGPPTGVHKTLVYFDSANFSWDKTPGIDSYNYLVDTDSLPGDFGTRVNDTTVSIHNLSPFTDYYFHVQAASQFGGDCSWATLKFNTSLPEGMGSLDKSFNKTGKKTIKVEEASAAFSVALQSDGKIVVAGYSRSSGNNDNFLVMRFNTNGTLDKTFGKSGKVITDSGTNDHFTSIAIQDDDKIVIAGYTNINDLLNEMVLFRYNANGSIDKKFGTGGKIFTDANGQNTSPAKVVVQPDKKIVVAATTGNGSNSDYVLFRFKPNGDPDPNFGTAGKVITDLGNNEVAKDMLIQPDGKIVVGGTSGEYPTTDMLIVRYNKNGTFDNKFGTGGKVYTDFGGSDYLNSIAILQNSKIIAGGTSIMPPNNGQVITLAKYRPSGDYETSFGTGGLYTYIDSNYDLIPSKMVLDKNKDIIVGGYAINGTNDYDVLLMRFLGNGRIDSALGYQGKVFTDFGYTGDFLYSMTVQDDNKVIAAGPSSDKIFLSRYIIDSIPPSKGFITQKKSNSYLQPKAPGLSLLPNPVKDILLVTGMQPSVSKHLFITDITGRTIQQFTTTAGSFSCNVNKLLPGMYFIGVSENNKTNYLKFVKE